MEGEQLSSRLTNASHPMRITFAAVLPLLAVLVFRGIGTDTHTPVRAADPVPDAKAKLDGQFRDTALPVGGGVAGRAGGLHDDIDRPALHGQVWELVDVPLS